MASAAGATDIRGIFDSVFRTAGLLVLLPWGMAIGGCLLAGTTGYAVAAVAITRDGDGGDAPSGAILGMMLGTLFFAIGLFLSFVVALSGNVHTPWQRVAKGILSGLGAALALTIVCCSGVAGLADSAPWSLTELALRLGGCGVSALGVYQWCRHRYDSPPRSAAIASGCVLAMGLMPTVTFAVLE